METKMLLTIVASYFKYDERYSKQLLLFGLDKKQEICFEEIVTKSDTVRSSYVVNQIGRDDRWFAMVEKHKKYLPLHCKYEQITKCNLIQNGYQERRVPDQPSLQEKTCLIHHSFGTDSVLSHCTRPIYPHFPKVGKLPEVLCWFQT